MNALRAFSALGSRLTATRVPLRALEADAQRAVRAARQRGSRSPRLAVLGDTSLWASVLLRGAAALRASVGSSLGLSAVLRMAFHIDVWTDDIGGGIRFPHPFNVVIGDGATLGEGCTVMHNVTVQRGAGTRIDDGAVLCTGATVLAGSHIGVGALVGAASVVRGEVPARSVVVGAPARVIRQVREGETE